MDPRIKTPPEGLAQQFSLATKLAEAMHKDFEALMQVRNLRKQLGALRERAAQGTAIAAALADLDRKSAALEGAGGFRKVRGSDAGVQENLVRLNGELSGLYEVIEGADAAPTTQAVAAVAELQKALDSLLARWQELRSRDIPALNEQLKQANLPPLMP
jgi:hypothetical protein